MLSRACVASHCAIRREALLLVKDHAFEPIATGEPQCSPPWSNRRASSPPDNAHDGNRSNRNKTCAKSDAFGGLGPNGIQLSPVLRWRNVERQTCGGSTPAFLAE